MKLREILENLDIISADVDMDVEISGVCCDSRKIENGFLFVAIRGFETDGNKYIAKAVENGAAVIITDNKKYFAKNRILVRDARVALAITSKNLRGDPTRDMKMIGITGTNGKTTVTYLIKNALEKNGAKCGLIGTNKNMIGDKVLDTERTTPESDALWELFSEMREAGCTHVIMEVSSHSLSLSRVHGIEYDVAAFTNISQDHLDFHKSMSKYEEAKEKLFHQTRTSVINYDDEAGKRISKTASGEVITYSAKQSMADYVAKNINLKPQSVEFEFVGIDTIGRVELGIPGEFSVYNAMCAMSVLLSLGLSLPEIISAMREMKGVSGRAEVVPTDSDYTVMIDYAHSPDGLINILKTVREVTDGRVITVFGCGGDRDRTKRPKMGKVVAECSDIVVVTSDNPRTEDPDAIIDDIIPGILEVRDDFIRESDRVKAIKKALSIAEKGDLVLLAGKGHETYQEINHVKHHLDEREVVKEYFAER